MRRELRVFWMKAALLFGPPLLALGVPAAVMWRTGEFITADEVARRIVAGEPVRYSQGCTDQWRRFKFLIASSMAAKVLVVGGSSSLQMRGDYLERPSYNAGSTIGSVWHLRELLHRLPQGRRPRVVVVGLHPYLFLDDWKAGARSVPFDRPSPSIVATVQGCAPRTALDLFQARLPISRLIDYPPRDVGMQLLLGSGGFRPDGSFDRGPVAPVPERFREQLADARRGTGYLPHGGEISAERVGALREFLDYAQANGIHVVAYLPPLAHPLREAMLALGPKYKYVFGAHGRLAPEFEARGFTLFDATDLRSFGARDTELLDATHPSETADLRLLLHLAARDPVLAQFIDFGRLRALLARSTPLSVLGD